MLARNGYWTVWKERKVYREGQKHYPHGVQSSRYRRSVINRRSTKLKQVDVCHSQDSQNCILTCMRRSCKCKRPYAHKLECYSAKCTEASQQLRTHILGMLALQSRILPIERCMQVVADISAINTHLSTPLY